MKLRGALLIGFFAAITCIVVGLVRTPHSEVLISSGISLSPQWQEIHLENKLQTKSVISELVVEMPDQQIRKIGNQLQLADGSPLQVEGYLTTEAGERFELDQVWAMVHGTKTFLRLSNARLECKKCDYRFGLAALRESPQFVPASSPKPESLTPNPAPYSPACDTR